MHNEQAKELVNSRIGLAYSIAAKMHRRTAPQSLSIDDMRSWALDGLLQAANNWQNYCLEHKPQPYSPEDVQYFTNYAQKRISGNIWDQLRKLDWIPRSVRTRMKLIQKIDPEMLMTEEELSEKSGLSIAVIRDTLLKISQKPISFDSGISEVLEPRLSDIASTVEAKRLLKVVVDAIRECPYEQQVVLALYYRKDMQLQNVAVAMGITDAVASALHKAAVMAVFETIKMAAEETYFD